MHVIVGTMLIFQKLIMNKVIILCMINVLAQCECTSIALEVSNSNIEENTHITLICSTDISLQHMLFLHTKPNSSDNKATYVIYNTTSNDCYVSGANEYVSNCFCDNSKRFTCRTKPLSRHNSGDSWYCVGPDSTKSNEINISITVPIQYANILEDTQGRIDTREGEFVKLTCESPFGIPAAKITWFLDKINSNTYDDDLEISKMISTSIRNNTDRTYNTTSILMHNASRNEDGMAVYCNASNLDSNEASSRKLVLNVRYKPDTTILINKNRSYTDYYMIRNSPTIQSLQCDVRGGKPFANLAWCCYSGNQTNTNTSTGVTSIVTWIAGTHNDSVCICNASHVLGWTDERKVSVHVLYPPSEPTCVVGTARVSSGPVNVSLASNFTMTCTSEAYPEPNTFLWSFPKGSTTKGSTLHLPFVHIDNEGIYKLYVENTLIPSIGDKIDGKRNATFLLRVHYPPTITNLTTIIEVLEGVNFSLTCKAEPGNPTITSFTWTSKQHPDRNTNNQHLILQNISRTEEGIFTCFAKNIMQPTGCQQIHGSDNKSVNVDVKYKASIKTFFAENTTVFHGKELSFACGVDSDPPANITMLSPTGSILKCITGSNKLHYIKRSSCLEDIGQFTCLSSNKHNRMHPDRRNIKVDVKCSPMYPLDYYQSTTINTRPGEDVMFNFRVFSNPPPNNFTWTNISNSMQNPIDSATSGRIIINTTDHMEYTIIITNVKPYDSGNYSVTVENEIGIMNETLRIVVDNQSIENDPSTINITPNNLRNRSNIGAVIGGSVGAITSVLIIAVVVIIIFYTRIKISKGTPHHDNNKLHILQNTIQERGTMETNFDNVLPISDETPKYEEEKNNYGNVHTKEASGKSLSIKTLRETVRQLKLDPVPLFKEFYTLQLGLQYDTKDALKPKNVAKNRYRSVYPYDASRVVLPLLNGDPDSDFINASYIDGYCRPRKYIAAQGPLENTISDIWRMIHSEDIKIIVMATNLIETGKRKCVKYWPDDRATYGKCKVKLDHVDEYADFVVRHITYSMDGTRFERQLIHFHYTSWPDKNVPSTALSLVQFWRKVRQSEFVGNTPWMVHCSAGVGRTGTFIALDYLYDQGNIDGKLNVPETVNILREQRISMVQTKEQYLYLHDAITELLDPVGQIFTPENSLWLRSTATEGRKLKKEFKVIKKSIVNGKTQFDKIDYDLKRMPDGLLPDNICKSIDQTVIPDDLFRPLISTGNTFINAVYIPTYRDAEKYIVTQYPLQNTVLDFVWLLWDHSIEDVVLLDVEDEKLHCYWPHNNIPLCIGPFVISLLSVDEGNYSTIRIIDLSLAERRQNKQTVVHQFTAWPGYSNLCEPKPLTEFLHTITRIAGPVLVQCHDGYSRSGLFAALLSIVDRIKTDNEVAIADTVRAVKHRRQAAITNVEQYQFCHEVVFEYLKNREEKIENSENQEYVNMTFPKFL